MSKFQENLISTFKAIGADIKKLNTFDKNLINDTDKGTDKVYSNQKVDELLGNLKSEIVGGADGAYDTLKEIEDLLKSSDSAAGALTTEVANKLDFTKDQTLDETKQIQALKNLGIDYNHDFLGDYTTSRDAN